MMADSDLVIAGKRLLDMRIKSQMTQQQVADLAGFTRGALQSWETATRAPKFSVIKKLAQIYGTTPAYLAGFTAQEENNTPYISPVASPEILAGETPYNDLIAFHKNILSERKINLLNCSLMLATDDYCHTQFRRGDYLLIDILDTAVIKPDLFAVSDGNNIIFRWARKETGSEDITIYSDDDKHFAPYRLSSNLDQSVRIIGKVIGVFSWR